MIGNCEYCGAENVEVKEYDLGDEDSAIGCVDEDRCRGQMNFKEWG